MKISELITVLQALPQDATVYMDVNAANTLANVITVELTAPSNCTLRNYVIKNQTSVTLNGVEYEVVFNEKTRKAR